jgi:hypothetical protein
MILIFLYLITIVNLQVHFSINILITNNTNIATITTTIIITNTSNINTTTTTTITIKDDDINAKSALYGKHIQIYWDGDNVFYPGVIIGN